MDSKSATKSKIPISKSKKEQTSDAIAPKLNKKEPPKALEVKITSKPKTTRSEPTKAPREVQIANRNAEKTTLSEKAACTLKNLKPKPQNKNALPKNIESLSKGMVNLMKTSKTQEFKTSPKLGATGVNRNSKHADGSSNSHITNSKDAKKDLAKIMAAPPTTVAKPLSRVSQLRRSRTELEFNFGKAGSSRTRPSLKIVPNEKKRNDKEVSALSGNETCAALEKNVLSKETSGNLGTQDLRKAGSSRTRQSLKIVPNEKMRNDNQDKEVSALSGNEKCSTLEKSVFPKETSPDVSIKPLVRSGSISLPKRPPLERKANIKPLNFQSKPLRRSKTFHVFDIVPVLKLTTTVATDNDTINLDSGKVHGTPENQQKNALGVIDLTSEVTPKRKIPHGGISFKMHGAKKVPSTVFNIQSEK